MPHQTLREWLHHEIDAVLGRQTSTPPLLLWCDVPDPLLSGTVSISMMVLPPVRWPAACMQGIPGASTVALDTGIVSGPAISMPYI